MGCVFSCLAGSFMVIGEVLENLFLMVGEIASVLVRGIFAVLVGLCDILAAISCCWRVPFSQRPDRETYTYDTINKNVGGRHGTRNLFSAQARKARKQEKENAKREKELHAAADAADQTADSQTPVVEKVEETPAVEEAPAPSAGWFSFLGPSKPQATPAPAPAPVEAPVEGAAAPVETEAQASAPVVESK